jgi:uncharacterized protein YdaU (DUF1376 family)
VLTPTSGAFLLGVQLGAEMHYYQFHIGDYASHTRHLSLIEDLAYRRLLDFYYLHEQPIKQRDIARQIGMRDQEQDVLTVLNEFFVSTDAGFVSPRADKEIQHYHSKVEQASKAGKASAERRSNIRSTGVQPTINHKPITINQEPRKEKVAVAPSVWPEWIPLEAWHAFLEMRKKTKKPPTEKAVELLLAKLKKFKDAGQDVQAILEKSITNNWQDVYEIKESKFGFVKPITPAERATNLALGRPADQRLLTPEEQAAREKARLFR